MPSTREMTVANIAFLLDRLAADTPPNQQIRELTQNAIEAIRRRQKNGDHQQGIIRWDIDWDHHQKTGEYKLSVVDNGDGMLPEQMFEYLNSLAVQGASQTQSISQNFGVGAKITALYRNKHGLVYQSWRNGRGSMVRLHRDDQKGVYGLAAFDLPDGTHYTPKLKEASKPRVISANGTKVTLLGLSEDENTAIPRDDAGGGMNWLNRYLTGRYFRIPEDIKIQVRKLTRDSATWPTQEPEPSDKTFNLETVKGTKALFDEKATKVGLVRLSSADVHWWLFDDPAQAAKEMSPRGGRTGQVGIVFQDEVYIQRVGQAARRILASFGVVFGAENFIFYLEPRGLDLRADTARSRIFVDAEDIEDAGWWERWGAEFQGRMPPEVRHKIDEIMALADEDPSGRSRERILERLRRIRELMSPTRYRRDPMADQLAEGPVVGGVPGRSERAVSGVSAGGPPRGGRSSDDYLAELVELDGEPADRVDPRPAEPEVKWVSKATNTRPEDELDDQAACLSGPAMKAPIIKANADFRGYRDVLSYFAREFNPSSDMGIERRIVEYVREWMECQLIEVVMSVRNLVNGRTWTEDDAEKALSPQALTATMMCRFHVVEKVRRALSSELSRPPQRAPVD